MPKRINWSVIEDEFVQGAMTYRDLAHQYHIGLSTLESKASAGDWQAKRKAFQAATESESLPVTATEVMPPLKMSGQIDTRVILDSAINRYYAALETLEPRSLERSTDALCRLLELRAKLYPVSLAGLVEQIIERGFTAKQLIEELKEQWDVKRGNP